MRINCNSIAWLLFISLVSATACTAPGSQAEKVVIVKESDIVRKTIPVQGMTCVGCEVTLEDNISRIEGVVSVKASHKNKEAIIAFDSTKTDLRAIAKAIEGSGYQPSTKGS